MKRSSRGLDIRRCEVVGDEVSDTIFVACGACGGTHSRKREVPDLPDEFFSMAEAARAFGDIRAAALLEEILEFYPKGLDGRIGAPDYTIAIDIFRFVFRRTVIRVQEGAESVRDGVSRDRFRAIRRSL